MGVSSPHDLDGERVVVPCALREILDVRRVQGVVVGVAAALHEVGKQLHLALADAALRSDQLCSVSGTGRQRGTEATGTIETQRKARKEARLCVHSRRGRCRAS